MKDQYVFRYGLHKPGVKSTIIFSFDNVTLSFIKIFSVKE